MASRIHSQPPLRAQQEQLHALLSQFGEAVAVGCVPAFPHGSKLQDFVVSSASVWLAAADKQAGKATNDVSACPDQDNQQHAQAGGWLRQELPAEGQIEDLEQECQRLEKQLAELQATDRALTSAHQSNQALHAQWDSQASEQQHQLQAQQKALQSVNKAVNDQLQALTSASQELEHLTRFQGSSWLLLPADRTPQHHLEDALEHHLNGLVHHGRMDLSVGASRPAQHITSVLHSQMLSSECGRQLTDLSSEECDAMMQEMGRLKMAYCLGTLEEVKARAELAGLQAQVARVHELTAEQVSHAGKPWAPWLKPAECERFMAHVQKLRQEQQGLTKDELCPRIDEVGRLQDARLLLGFYQLQYARSLAGVRDRQAIIMGLLTWGAQSQVLDTLRTAERVTLSQLYESLEDLQEALEEVQAGAAVRVERYRGGSKVSDTRSSPTPRSPATAAQQQELKSDSLLSCMWDLLMPSQPPQRTTLRNLVKALHELQSKVQKTSQNRQAYQDGLPKLMQAGIDIATAAHSTLCGPGAPLTRPVLAHPQLAADAAESERLRNQLQESCNECVNTINRLLDRAKDRPEAVHDQRKVLELFWNHPQKLNERVEQLQEQSDSLQELLKQ